MTNNKGFLEKSEHIFESINGKNTKLIINQYENKRGCVEIILEEVHKAKVKKKSIAVCLLAIFNLISFYFNLFMHKTFLLIFTVVSIITVTLLLKIKNERLLIIKSLGIQFTVTYYFGSSTTQFIPWNSIKKVFINEVISLQKVLYYITIMTESEKHEESLLILFKHTKPRLKCLEVIYKKIVEVMH